MASFSVKFGNVGYVEVFDRSQSYVGVRLVRIHIYIIYGFTNFIMFSVSSIIELWLFMNDH